MSQNTLPAKTSTVIIGSGIVGCSVAYHLQALGHTDVVVLDKGDLHHNDGSTSHAPGGVHVTSPSKMMTDFAVYSTDLYAKLEPFVKDKPCHRPVSGIELATTPSRWQELKRRHGIATAYGVESHLLTPEQCAEKVSLLDPDSILGGFWVPRDCNVGGSHLTSALARDTEKGGVKFFGECKVERLLLNGDKVVGVQHAHGELRADQVLVCTNIWAPILSRQVGLELPLMAAQHQYVVTKPLPELKEYKGQEIVLPTLRHQDSALYYRQHGDCWGIGNYRHEPLMVAPKDVGKTAMRDFTPEHFKEAWEASCVLFPCLKGVELERSFNGMFAFTLDGAPILGPTKIDGLWTAVGVWITHAGGVGKAVAEWLVNKAPQTDCREANVNRFHDFQTQPGYVRARCARNYAEVYDIHHPAEPLAEPRNVRHTPVHTRMAELGAKFVESGGWEMPKWYESNAPLLEKYKGKIPTRDEWSARFWSPIQGAEHLAVRESAGLFNVGALAVVEVTGPGALDYVQHLCTNNVDKSPGRLIYTAMLNHGGGVRADLTVARWENSFWLINGGAIHPREWDWLNRHLPDDSSVHLTDHSSTYTTLGLWGPNARKILQSISPGDLSNEAFRFYRCQEIGVADIPVKALRLSYAGELGWELYVKADFAVALWDAIWEAGKEHGLIAAGGGAFDSLRMEKAFRLWGQDMTTEHIPEEVGLSFVVADKPFLGKEAMESREARTKLVCLALKDRGALLGGEPVFAEGQPVGYVTSANMGYSVEQFLALGHVKNEALDKDNFEIEYLGKRFKAERVSDPVFDPKMERLRS